MPRAAANPMMRALIVLFGVMAGILAFAIYIAANSPTHSRVEAVSNEETRKVPAAIEEKTQAEEARKKTAEHLKSLEEENADLRKQLELARSDLRQQAAKLAAADQEGLRLRSDRDAALKRVADASQKDAESLVKLEEDSPVKPAADAVKKDTDVKVAQAPAAEVGNKRHVRKSGNNGNKGGSVAVQTKAGPSFSELDTNQDGKLSLEEYKAGFPEVADVEKEFKALDTNGDGFLSIDEYQAGHPVPALPHKKRPKKN